MKKLIVITGIILIGYLLLITFASQQTQVPAAVSAQAEQLVAEKEYKIGVSDGRVAVFHNGKLYLKTETMLSSLPKSDRKRIEKGIEFDSLKELKLLLQDYCS